MTQPTIPLIVPLTVEALVVNDAVRGGNFLRSQMQYNELDNQITGPTNAQGGSGNNDTNFTQIDQVIPNTTITTSDYYNGVYLKWRMPKAFTHGVHDGDEHDTRYPRVPNRWLIVRFSGVSLTERSATAWIIESDHLSSEPPTQPQNVSQETTMFLSKATHLTPIYIGRNSQVSGTSWTESGLTLELSAVGPGNSAFSAYQPQCNNVFSFVDCLNGQSDQTLSYAVYGWFSNQSHDPLQQPNARNLPALLKELGWRLPDETPDSAAPAWCLLAGAVNGVKWQSTALPPGGAPSSDERPLSIAFGANSVEALSALLCSEGEDKISANFLNAFQLDAFALLDRPDGVAELHDKLQHTFFQRYSGGYSWEIVDAPGNNGPLPSKQQREDHKWLAHLNNNQKELDSALLHLAHLQTELYCMWWKSIQPYATKTIYQDGKFVKVPLNPNQPPPSYFATQLDPTISGSLANRTFKQHQTIHALRERVPHGKHQAELQASIDRYAKSQDLPSSKHLKRTTDTSFFCPNDPVVLLTGVGAQGIAKTAKSVLCRLPSQLVSGFTFNGKDITAQTPNLAIPQPDLSKVLGVPWTNLLMENLITEFFFLDPSNAAAINAAVPGAVNGGVNPDSVLGVYPDRTAHHDWKANPWRPLLLIWEGFYYPIDYGAASAPNWSFAKNRYFWNGSQASVGSSIAMSGLIQLAPTASQNIKRKIEKFLDHHPHLTDKQRSNFQILLTTIETTHEWDILSQSLDGFNSQLLLRLPGVYQSPHANNPPLAQLIGHIETKPPLLLDPQNGQTPPSLFQPWRAGQFQFTSLVLVDEWGQALWPITSNNYETETIFTSPRLTPQYDATSATSGAGTAPVYHGNSLVQLPPALLQPARLRFSFVSARADSTDYLPENAATSPICGWILPNHLDHSLMAYCPHGDVLGEISVNGSGATTWTSLPTSPYADLQEIAEKLPHFGNFLLNLAGQPAESFSAFLQAVDETLWTTVPSGTHFDKDLAVLMGRPLVMLRAKVELSLDGPPYSDPSWQYTEQPQPSPVSSYQFAVELGNRERLEDGLIGYFVQDNYTNCNVVAQAGASSVSYLQTIGANNNYLYLPPTGTNSTCVSMIVDPRASVHATTSVLPVTKLTPPPRLISQALANLKVSFRVDGILTDQAQSKSGKTSLLMPTPQEKSGKWIWIEEENTNSWSSYTVEADTTDAKLSPQQPIVRRGRLQFSSVG